MNSIIKQFMNDMTKRISAIEIVVLQLRYFIDESLIFIERYEKFEREEGDSDLKIIKIKENDLSKIRLYVIQCIRLVFYLKQIINQDFHEYNNGIQFERKFQQQRTNFFQIIFKRLELLLAKLRQNPNMNEFIVMYAELMNKIAKCTNQWVDYIELRRWSKNLCLEHLDLLIRLANDFLFVFENVLKYLITNDKIDLIRNEDNQMDSSDHSFVSVVDLCDNNNNKQDKDNKRNLDDNIIFRLMISCLAIIILYFVSSKFCDKKVEISNNQNNGNKNKETAFIVRLFKLIFYIDNTQKEDKQSNEDIYWCRIFFYLSNVYFSIFNLIFYWIFELIVYFYRENK